MYPPIHKFYDRVNAQTLVGGAKAAYGDLDAIREWASGIGCEICEVIEDAGTETRVFAAAGDGFVIVCFRGTADLRNWLTDLDARRVEVKWDGEGLRVGLGSRLGRGKVEVHEGFLGALESVWGRLEAVVQRMAGRTRTVFFAGHSLGGALAMLAAARWAGGGSPANNDLAHYSFGQPRVGNAAWARWYDARLGGRSFRVIHADDVIARVPWLLKAYRHAGVEVFYPALRRHPAAFILDCPWWRKLASDAVNLWQEWRKGQIALLADHHVDSYVRLLSPAGRDAQPGTCSPRNNADFELWNRSNQGSTESHPTNY